MSLVSTLKAPTDAADWKASRARPGVAILDAAESFLLADRHHLTPPEA